MKKYKSVLGVLGIIAVEAFFYFRSGQNNPEMFFMIWVFISAALILNNTFRRGDRAPIIGLGGNDSVKYAYLASSFMEKELEVGIKNKPPKLGGLFDLWNLLYLGLLIANILGYILVMPK